MLLRYCSVGAACLISLGSSAALAGLTNPLLPANDERSAAIKGQFMDELNLSNAQKQKFQQIYRRYQGQISQHQDKLLVAQQQLKQMMIGTDSAAAIRTQYQEVVRLRQALDNLRFESMLEMREVLTPNQRRQFALLMQQRRDDFPRFDNR